MPPDLRQRLERNLSREELAVVWHDVFGLLLDDAMPGRSHAACTVETVERARRTNRTAELVAYLRERFPQVFPPETEAPRRLSPTLPRRNPLFTGREAELAQVHQALKTGVAALTSGVAALHGLGGEGKTQTAVEYAHRYAAEYERVFFVRAERPGDFEVMMGDLAGELGVPESPDFKAQFRDVLAWFEGHGGWLLIVDNAEDLPTLERILPHHPQGRVLVTTRERVLPRFGTRVEIAHLDDETGALLLLRVAGLAPPADSAPEADA